MTRWTPIALGKDIPTGVTRAVIFEGLELVSWRGRDGAVHVWADRCPHRGMRLSFGFVRDNALNCLYHGWEYGAGAQCLRIPAHPDLSVPSSIRATAFPAQEALGMVFASIDGDAHAPLPLLSAGAAPVLSLAVEAEPETILASTGAAIWADGVQLAQTAVGRTTLFLGWHCVGPGRTMVHAAAAEPLTDSDRALAVQAIRDIRRHAEAGVAA